MPADWLFATDSAAEPATQLRSFIVPIVLGIREIKRKKRHEPPSHWSEQGLFLKQVCMGYFGAFHYYFTPYVLRMVCLGTEGEP